MKKVFSKAATTPFYKRSVTKPICLTLNRPKMNLHGSTAITTALTASTTKTQADNVGFGIGFDFIVKSDSKVQADS